MLDKKDLNKYNTTSTGVPTHRVEGEFAQTAGATAKTMGGMVWKALKTVICVLFVTGVLVFLSVAAFLLSFRDIDPPDLNAISLKFSSIVYLDGTDGSSSEYMTIHADENRVWVSLNDIPAYMKTAQVAIEDHRFCEHKGVDWRSTMNAAFKLFSNTGGGGGSTLTQQLIKNITDQKQVSILRKVREIFTALNMEKEYSKQQILEAYLNQVNYGGQNQGVEAAAKAYFGKSIGQCSLAECALIAGITQNPAQYNPLVFPEEAKARAQTVLDRMWELSDGVEDADNDELVVSGEMEGQLVTITKEEYDAACAELAGMTFDGDLSDDENQETVEEQQDENAWNWYIDTMFDDIVNDLVETYNYSPENAVSMIYNSGLEIHCAMNLEIQSDLEEMFLHGDCMPEDPDIQAGLFVMDPYTGRVIAVVGSRDARQGVRLYNMATDAERQPGSSFKPVSVYSLGLETGAITYGSVLNDIPIPGYFGEGSTQEGPQNVSNTYTGAMNVDNAIEVSQNAPAAWLAKELTPEACYEWLTQKLHFTTLTEEDSHSLSAMALGGMSYGVTVREMTAAFCVFANGGYYYEPYTYTYVKDHDGNVILDNRDNTGEQVMSTANATVMNKLLHRPVEGYNGTAANVMWDIGVDMFAKTGTTDDAKDLYFVGGTPFCVAGLWNGYEIGQELWDSDTCKVIWKAVIQYLNNNYDWSDKQWVLSDSVIQYTFCRSSGKIAGPGCYNTAVGWYDSNNLPGTCNGGSDHYAGAAVPGGSPAPGGSAEPDTSPEPGGSPEPGSPEPGSPEPGSPEPGSPEPGSPGPGETDEPIVTPGPGETDEPVITPGPTDTPIEPTEGPTETEEPPPVETEPPVTVETPPPSDPGGGGVNTGGVNTGGGGQLPPSTGTGTGGTETGTGTA